ncbi:RHS repeat-associated core domain-containing protein [Leifsonia shinshuensis]|uniref:RHS repeat-associated core domain-containing protein n=1 Tax=Leifsonia shinshuensis TaxID=150026 RepID=UPI0028675D46|nr:RHS repeat-associated core domain-containing protein [Leifsonia shinshuensis]MDR6973167.1 RHS repeat-associated protein [Leifsonia shinshuensis]
MRSGTVLGVIATIAVAAVTIVGTATPAEASAWEKARRTAAATLAEVRSAAAVSEERAATQTDAPEPEAEGTVRPDAASTVSAKDAGVSVTFSGNDVEEELTVEVGEAPKDALVSAQAERPGGGMPVSDPVQITAADRSGAPHTTFPAKRIHTRGGGKKGPIVSDVVPGVSLSLKPDLDAVKAQGLDAASLKIYTRERAGEPWVALPSYFDSRTGTVKGESTHLSQFVVIGTKFVPPPGPVVVLDPDNDEGHVSTPAPPVTELGYNIRLAQLVRGALQQSCRATVTITREDPAVPFISRTTRAGIAAAANPVATLGIGFNTFDGVSWGGADPTLGGSQVYSRGGAADDALSNSLVGNLPTYTTRPAKNMENNGNFPGDEFAAVPGALTHLEALFLDNNLDRAWIDGGFPHIADGVFTGLGKWLEAQGFDCTDPVTGGWPSPPSAAEIARLALLGLHNYLTYGGEPFSFSTGNLVEQEKLFTLPGLGGSSTDVTLFYNSQDGRLSRVGAGWSFGLGARAQRFSDGSVMVVRADGASFVFTGDGHGGYQSVPGLHQTLTEQPGGRLLLRDVSGEAWVFDASDIEGIGELVSHTDAQGNTTTLTYGAPDPDVQQFVPLTSITVPGGQVIQVTSDALGRVTAFTRPGGDRWSLSYDVAGDLTTVTLPDGRTHRFGYDSSHQLLTAVDATGTQYLKNQYDASGRIVKQWDATGKLRSLDYSKPGQTTYTDTLGRVSVYFYDSAFRITKVQHPDGTTASFSFDAQNNVTSSTDENARITTYTYDGSGNILTEKKPSGQVVAYTYTPTGQLATKTDAGGPKGAPRTWAYDYDAAGRLVTTHQPDGTTVTNVYDATGNILKTVQPSGATTSYGHDAAGNITVVTDPVGAVTRYGYDSAGRITSKTDPNGRTTTYGWDNGDRVVAVTDPAGAVTTYGYEPNDHVASVTDPNGATSQFAWDALFHLTSATTATGGTTSYTYDSEDSLLAEKNPLGSTTSYATDSQDRVSTVTDPNGGVWKRTYDGVGNVTGVTSPSGATTRYRYDADGALTSQTDATGAVTRYRYDAVGRMIAQVDPDGVTTRYAYDVMDRVIRVTDGTGKHTDVTYDADGNVTSVVNRRGDPTTFTYDAAGRMTSTTTPLGERTSFAYDAAGNRTAVTDPLGRTTTTTYTATGLVASTTDPAGHTTTYTYDAAGRRTGVTDANGHTTSTAYDADGRQTSLTDPTGAVTAYEYDAAGQQSATVTPNGNRTQYAYDPAGQLTKVVEGHRAGAPASSDTNVATAFTYDTDGNLTAVTDPNGHITRYTVDPLGRTTSETNAVGNTSRTTYTAAGRTASVVTGTGATTAYGYDRRGDLIRQDAAGAIATFEYDGEQKLIAVTDPGGVTGFTYDKDGRTTTQIDQQGGRLHTAYDAAGQTTGVTLPTGQKLSYTYDQAGRATSQSSPWGSLSYEWDPAGNLTRQTRSTGVATGYAYDAADRVTTISHVTPEPPAPAAPSPTPTPAPYSSRDAAAAKCSGVAGYLGARATATNSAPLCERTAPYLAGRTVPTPTNPVPDGGVLSYRYTYDGDGNVASATRTIASGQNRVETNDSATPTDPLSVKQSTVSYAYDALDRLTGSTATSGEKNIYGYDAAGNRTSWSRSGAKDGNFSQKAVFSDANQLTRSTTTGRGRGVPEGVASYAYDGAGNRVDQVVGGVSTRFAYNPAGQTTQATREGRSTSYGYDGLGRRTTTTDHSQYGTTTTRTAFDGLSPVQSSIAGKGTETLIRDAIGVLVEHVSQNGEATWDLLDRLGSTVAGARGASITELSSYEDWGAQQFETTGWSSPLNFTGETTDPTQGLNHYHARTYDPAAASWTSADPWHGLLAQPQSLHRYAYVENNPASDVDVLGFKAKQQRMPQLFPGWGALLPPIPPGLTKAPATSSSPGAKPPANPAPTPPSGKSPAPSKPKPVGPNSQNDVQERHDEARDKAVAFWSTASFYLGIIGGAADVLSLVLLFSPGVGPAAAAIAKWIGLIANVASTAISCILAVAGESPVGCVVGAIGSVLGIGASAFRVAIDALQDSARVLDKALAALGVQVDLVGFFAGLRDQLHA